jgi:hypothetical protein
VVTSTDIIGSSSAGSALRAASFITIEPAILNAISDESTSWYWPSSSVSLHADQRVAGEHAVLHGVLRARVHRGDELLGDAATGHRVDELVRGAVGLERQRLQLDDDLRVLARATGLLLVHVVELLHRAADRLPVRHLRLTDVRLDVELAAHAVDEDVEVQLAHAGDDRLPGLLVVADAEGRVLLGQALDRGAQLLLVRLGLRLDGDLDDRLRERSSTPG